jgi:hypothetical protein
MLHITNRHVKTTIFELTILLAQGTVKAEKMNTAIPTWALFQHILSSQFRSIIARVPEPTTSESTDQVKQGRVCTAS